MRKTGRDTLDDTLAGGKSRNTPSVSVRAEIRIRELVLNDNTCGTAARCTLNRRNVRRPFSSATSLTCGTEAQFLEYSAHISESNEDERALESRVGTLLSYLSPQIIELRILTRTNHAHVKTDQEPSAANRQKPELNQVKKNQK